MSDLLAAGVVVAVSGVVSGIFVVIANAWMNAPTGFRMVGGVPLDIDPIAAMLNPAAFSQTLHMTLAAYAATGLGVAGIHATLLLRHPGNAFHRRALRGWPDVDARTTHWAIRIPSGLSLLAHHDPAAVVTGLDSIPRDQWPAIPVVHAAFQIMVALGSYLALVSAWALWRLWRRRGVEGHRPLLLLLALATPLGFIATEAERVERATDAGEPAHA